MLTPCPECGVPEYFIKEHVWLDNGEFAQKRDLEHRFFFIESANIDALIRGIGETIGADIERFATDAMRKAVRWYVEQLIPNEIKIKVRAMEMSPKHMHDVLRDVARPMGFGNYQFVDMRYEGDDDDYFTVNVSEPWSVPGCAAAHCGTMEAILGYDHGVTYSKTGPDSYDITAFPSEHPEELRSRLSLEMHRHVTGDIELERCAHCGGPKGLSALTWHVDRGVIMDNSHRRRMAVQGPHELEPVFRELEMERGGNIPRIVVEAQKRFVKTGFFSLGDISDQDTLRTRLAVLGRGNLRELKFGRQGLNMRLDNAAMPLLFVGMLQGIYDMAYGVDSVVEWELSEDGDLEVKVTPGD